MAPYTPPEFDLAAFNCPNCGAFASQTWSYFVKTYGIDISPRSSKSEIDAVQHHYAKCTHCKEISIWRQQQMIYPANTAIEMANVDMPPDVLKDYNEARAIFVQSPRGAAALIRLALQKLCGHIGESGENINQDIKNLVKRGLPEPVAKALDSVRVIGNNAVHPGQIDINDNPEIAVVMFRLLNFICNHFITEQKTINEIYNILPQKDRENIAKRDGGQAST